MTSTPERFNHGGQTGTRACGMGWSVLRHILYFAKTMGMSAEPRERRPAVPFVDRRCLIQSRPERITCNGLEITWAVREPPISKSKPCDFSLEKAEGSARQSDSPFFGQKQRQSTCNH